MKTRELKKLTLCSSKAIKDMNKFKIKLLKMVEIDKYKISCYNNYVEWKNYKFMGGINYDY